MKPQGTWKRWIQLGVVVGAAALMGPGEGAANTDPRTPWIYYDGQTGPAVDCVQLVLMFCAGQQIAWDGVYGPQTRQGVINLQRLFGLTQDGVVGPKTGEALKFVGNSRNCIIPTYGYARIFDLYSCQVHVPTET